MNRIEFGDCWDIMRRWKVEGVRAQTCVTSPPYYGLRDYGVEGQLGMEDTYQEYVENLVHVFRCVRDILRKDGTVWLNLGDSYSGSGKGQTKNGSADPKQPKLHGMGLEVYKQTLPPKNLMGLPWRVAFALQEDGWFLRQDIIWNKPNAMPSSVKDRCTTSHEYIFLLSKSKKYYFDHNIIKEGAITKEGRPAGVVRDRVYGYDSKMAKMGRKKGGRETGEQSLRRKRSVWSVTTKPYKGAHCAPFPPDLIEPCILAGCPEGGIVLDPFMGSGTTAYVAKKNNRQYLGCELNPKYKELQSARLSCDA